MRKIFTLIVCLMATLAMSAQTSGIQTQKLSDVLQKNTEFVPQFAAPAAPRKELAENQLWMGNYLTDEVAGQNDGLGFTSLAGRIKIATPFPKEVIEGYDGGQMVGMRVGIACSTTISNMFIYGYTTSGTMEVIQEVTTNVNAAGWNQITFETPSTLDVSQYSELLVGFTYNQTSSNYPLSLINSGTLVDSYIYGDYGSGEAWYSFNSTNYGNLSVQVLVEKEFAKYNVDVASCKDAYASAGEAGTLKFVLSNKGTEAVENVSYTVTYEGSTSEEQTYTLSKSAAFGESFTLPVAAEAQAEPCTKTYTVTVTKVNGEENVSAKNTLEGKYVTIQEVFKHRPVVEEFTGTGCGWCPRGWVGMEKIRELYGSDAIGIAIHQYNSSDPMYPTSYASLSWSGAPSSMVERDGEVDPGDAWAYVPTHAEEIAPVGVEVSGVFSEDYKTVDVSASFKAHTSGATYSVEYVLVADGLYNSSWAQSNYYYQYTAAQAGVTGTPLADFCKGGKYGQSSVKGLTFNDVAIASSYVSGNNKGADVTFTEAYAPVEGSYTLKMPTKTALLTAIKNANYDVYAVALVVDKNTGKIVNAGKAKVAVNPTGISSVSSDATEVARYALDGKQINGEVKGVNIVKMSDGTVKKVLVQ